MQPTLDDVEIRHQYKSGDIGAIINLHGELYDFGQSFEAYVATTLGEFYQSINLDNERIWLAIHNERIIGSVALKNTDSWAQLRYFLIHPDYRGIGLGKHLLGLFTAFMESRGYRKSFLLTEENLTTAAALYGKMSYRYVSSSETGFGLVEQRYELYL